MFVFRWTAFRLALVSVVLVTAVVVSTLLLVKDPGMKNYLEIGLLCKIPVSWQIPKVTTGVVRTSPKHFCVLIYLTCLNFQLCVAL